MTRTMMRALLPALALSATLGAAVRAQGPVQRPAPRTGLGLTLIERDLRHELATLSRYGVFDHLAFRLDENGVATLLGHVRSQGLRSEAERAAREVAGVREVQNRIEVLTPSASDDRLRVALFDAIYRSSALERYAFQSMPPIHIVVQGGRVTLEGVVGSDLDRTMAAMRARDVAGVLGVTNNLVVQQDSAAPRV